MATATRPAWPHHHSDHPRYHGEERNWERFLVERSVDGIVVVSSDGVISELNPAAEHIFRATAKEAVGQPVERFVPARLRARHRELVADFYASDRHAHEMQDRQPVAALRLDGTEFFADIALIPIVRNGAPAIACVVRDVTERIDAEAAALQAEKLEALRMLSAGLAHDFNNILATIIGNADLARAFVGSDSPAFLPLHDIRKAGERAAEMVQQMLRFAGRGDAGTTTAEVGEVIVEMLRLLRSSLKANVTCLTDIEAGLPPVGVDPTSVRQIVMNLVVNAAEAIGEAEGRIVVGAHRVYADRRTLRSCYGAGNARAGEFVIIEVADTGPGMDRATRAHLFDPFFSTKFAGRGLGLASVLGIVRASGGGIQLRSRVGHGSVFRVFLPAGKRHEDVASGEEPAG